MSKKRQEQLSGLVNRLYGSPKIPLAFGRGYIAGNNDKTIDANPYSKYPGEFYKRKSSQWLDGWFTGRLSNLQPK